MNIIMSDMRQPRPNGLQSPRPAPIRVLAAEDNAINQAILQAVLRPFGIDPVIVGDGEQALAAWRDSDWDLVLMDIQMPHMDGVDATRAIRQEEQRTGCARTPIIALTSDILPAQVKTYLAAGMDNAVGKPIEVPRLLAAITDAIAPRAASAPQPASRRAGGLKR